MIKTVAMLCFQFTSFFLPWAVVLWLTHFHTIEDVANYSLLLALLAPFCLIIASPSRNYLLSSDVFTLSQAVSFRLIMMALGVIYALVVGGWQELVMLAVAIYLAKVCEFLFDIPLSQSLKRKQTRDIAFVTLQKMLITAIGLATMWCSESLLVGLSVIAVLFLLLTLRYARPHWCWPAGFIAQAQQVLPLSLSALVFSCYFNIPRYVLGGEHSEGSLAIYTIGGFVLTLLLMVNNALCQMDLPKWKHALNSSNGKVRLVALINKAFVRAGVLLLVVQLLHLPWVYDEFWALHNNINHAQAAYDNLFRRVLWLAWGPLLFSTANYLLIVTQQHRLLLKYTTINTLLSALSAWWALHWFGELYLLYVVALSGLVHFALCWRRFLICLNTLPVNPSPSH